ncbi:hypothetical protein D3Y59_12240 [Hymenobacter oligotrophus]|uniref:Uncharacterized protein n=1 Tax=Hymenobacter oligotrophus TaxID=2319843 RepID=A0A3B7RAG3_9BACT|nr:hypothetical protein D3Y59_12240 [Hymenobacter oligotrophus]
MPALLGSCRPGREACYFAYRSASVPAAVAVKPGLVHPKPVRLAAPETSVVTALSAPPAAAEQPRLRLQPAAVRAGTPAPARLTRTVLPPVLPRVARRSHSAAQQARPRRVGKGTWLELLGWVVALGGIGLGVWLGGWLGLLVALVLMAVGMLVGLFGTFVNGNLP